MPDIYDVAISFRYAPDNVHANALYELLRDRVSVFYSEDRLEENVGTDGEESYGHIFRDRCRLAVILYRKDWGKTRFTAAEENAIRQRADREGYGFSLWVAMEEDKAVPPYLPPSHVWWDFNTYGINGLAPIIEERLRSLGLQVRPENPLDKISRLRRTRELNQKRVAWRSEDGLGFVRDELKRLKGLIDQAIATVKESDPDIFISTTEYRNPGRQGVVLRSGGFQASFMYQQRYGNTVEGTALSWESFESVGNVRVESRSLGKTSYSPDLDQGGRPGWRNAAEHLSLDSIVTANVLDFALRVARQMSSGA